MGIWHLEPRRRSILIIVGSMVHRFIYWFESKTGVYLYPRFVLSAGFLFGSIAIFLLVSFFANSYAESVKTTGPATEKERAEYDAKMRAIHPASLPSATR